MVPKLRCARFQSIALNNDHDNSILIGFTFVARIREYFSSVGVSKNAF